MFANHVRGNGVELGASLIDGGARSEFAEELGHAMHAALHHRGGEVVRAGDDVGDDFGFGGVGNGGLKHADDGCRARAEADGFADDARIAIERSLPERISENSGAFCVGAVVAHVEQAAERGMKSHHFKICAADDAGADFARLAETDHRETDDGEVAESC